MKRFKLSFALIVAVVAIATTVATNASAIAGKVVSGCWKANSLTIQVRDLVNPASPAPGEIFSPVFDLTDCVDVQTEVNTNLKQYLRVISGSPIQPTGCDFTSVDFCCLELQEIATPNDPLYADVPFINLGDGNKKYEIIDVKCRP